TSRRCSAPPDVSIPVFRKPCVRRKSASTCAKRRVPGGARMASTDTAAEKKPVRAAKPTEEPRPQAYYDRIKAKFAEERDLRLKNRPEGTAQYTSELTGSLAKYATDPYADDFVPRAPIDDTVECLFVGGGFSALLTAARLRERGVQSIRIVERGADV